MITTNVNKTTTKMTKMMNHMIFYDYSLN